MKIKIMLFITIIVFVAVNGLQATDIDFYNDGIIQTGDEYDDVNVYNNATVDMSGGYVVEYYSHNTSLTNFSNGQILRYYGADSSELNMYGGSISQSLGLGGSAIANLYGGSIDMGVSAVESSIINVYGYNFTVVPTGNSYDLYGFWANGEAFDIYLRGPTTYPRVVLHEIPEPSTILLLSFGCLCLRR